MLTDSKKAELMMLAGVLHDISEKAPDLETAIQTYEAMENVYKILRIPKFEVPPFKFKNQKRAYR